MTRITLLLTALLLPALSALAAEPATAVGRAIAEAMTGSVRSDADRARDANRKPRETLEFFGLERDMRVLELIPGGAWYTRILAPVLRDDGELYVALGGMTRVEELKSQRGFDHINVLNVDARFERDGRRLNLTGPLDFGVRDVDLVLTFRNLHNLSPDARRAVNAATFQALAPGGYYGVVDHTRRHMQPDDVENWRRMDPVLAIEEIQAVGFELIDYSDLHYRLDDELRYEVGRRSVTGNTDRFTLLFRKPR